MDGFQPSARPFSQSDRQKHVGRFIRMMRLKESLSMQAFIDRHSLDVKVNHLQRCERGVYSDYLFILDKLGYDLAFVLKQDLPIRAHSHPKGLPIPLLKPISELMEDALVTQGWVKNNRGLHPIKGESISAALRYSVSAIHQCKTRSIKHVEAVAEYIGYTDAEEMIEEAQKILHESGKDVTGRSR